MKKNTSQLSKLAVAYRNGNETVYDKLFEDSLKCANNVARKKLEYQFNTEAEDIAFEATLKTLNNLSKMENPSGYTSYLVTATLNGCNDYFRTTHFKLVQNSQQLIFDKNDEENMLVDCLEDKSFYVNPERMLDSALSNDIITEVLETIPEEQRIAFEYVYMQDYKYKEVAELLDEKVSTIIGRVNQAKSKFKKEFLRINQQEIALELY